MIKITTTLTGLKLNHGPDEQNINRRNILGTRIMYKLLIILFHDKNDGYAIDVTKGVTLDGVSYTDVYALNTALQNSIDICGIQEVFTATEGQTIFAPTFLVNERHNVFITGVKQVSGYTRAADGSNITFAFGIPAGTEIVIQNL